MADRQISVLMESRYKSDLSKQLYKDEQRMKRFEERLKRNPLVIPVRLDLKGAMTQAAALRKAILGEFARMPATILGADGRPATAPASGGRAMNKKAGVLSTTEFQKWDDKEKRFVTEQIQQVEQLGRGISQLSKFKGDASQPFATITKDITNVQDLRDSLRGMNKELGEVYGKARGRGDKAGQIAALTEQRNRLNAALQQAAGKGLENSPDYTRAENQISRIGERIASLQGGQENAAAKQARKDRTRDVANQIGEEERRVQAALKGNKMEMDASERIKDRATREAEVNRLYAERQKLFEESRNKFRAMDSALQGEDRPDLADRALRRGLGMDNQVNQVPLDKQRAETDRLREDDKQREKAAAETKRKADQAKRAAAAADKASNLRNFGRALRLDDHTTKLELQENDRNRVAAAAIPDRLARERELNEALKDREAIYKRSAARMGIMENNANLAGNPVMAAKAEAARLKSELAMGQVGTAKLTQIEKSKRLAEAAAAKSGNRNFGRALRLDDNTTKLQLAQNKADEAAAKAIPDRTAREAELNRVLSERSRIYQEQQARLQQLQQTQTAASNLDNAAKAEAARLKAGQNAAGVGVSQTKAGTDAQLAARKQAEAAAKKADAKARADRESAFTQEMQDIKSRSDKRIAQINANERRERAAATTAEQRRAASAKAHSLRVSEFGNLDGAYQGVESRARAAGHTSTADTARGKSLGAQTAAARDMEKFNASTAKSGHALNFHSSALLRNAATFARWMIPVQVVLALTRAFNAGVQGAIRVDRQFATLRSVFRGTAEEVQQLKNDTLDMAVAQGRSADEAMDAAIRWSRLGLNRVQVNQAVKTSLMAANVAEMTAAETSEKLAAIYATYRLNVGDLPVVLSRLNAISNRYNVTNKDLLEGLVRVAGVAKQSGMELRDLEGIIGAVTGATGRPGQEVGNALKFVITRLAAPETMKGLMDNFDIDLTDSNGDLKEMSQIFAELAAIYPTLNNAQKQLFLKLTAGSRQASRFALVLDQYRQSQILAAEAGFDSASAYQENIKILESLQSRLESLKAAWTGLFTTMGDAGAFDFVERRLRAIQGLIQEINGGGADPAKKRPFKINDPRVAETVENLGGDWDTVFGTRDDFSRKSVMRTVVEIDKAIKAREKLVRENADSVGNVPMAERLLLNGGNGLNGILGTGDKSKKLSEQNLTVFNPNSSNAWETFGGIEEAKKMRETLLAALADEGDNGATDAISAMTAEVDALRERLGSLQRSANVFDSLNEGIRNGSVDRQTMVRDFENGAHLMLNLEDGATKYGDAIARFYNLLEAGDTAGIATLAEEISAMFKGDLGSTGKNLEQAMKPALESLRAKLVEIDKKRRDIIAGPQGKNAEQRQERQDNLEKIQGDYKAVQSAIEQVTQAQEKFNKSVYSFEASANINKYFADLIMQAEAVAEAFKDFAPDADNDPVERIFQRRRQAVGSGVAWLKQTRDETLIRREIEKSGALAKIRDANNTISEGGEDIEILRERDAKERRSNPGNRNNIESAKHNISRFDEYAAAETDPEDKKYWERKAKDEREYLAKEEAKAAGPDGSIAAKQAEIAAAKKIVEEQQRILDQQDEAVQLSESRLLQAEQELDVLLRKLDYEERIAEIQRASTDGSRKADNSSQAWRFGEEESDKDRNQAQLAIERAARGLDSARGLPKDNFAGKAAISGQVLQDEATARGALEAVERRQYEIDAARKQIAIDTVKAMREQTEEASKRLMLASREDQLRAAALARTIRDTGPVKDKEFFALSQESRQAMVNYLPNQAPDMLNEAKVSAAKARRELDAEQGRITSTIGNLRGALDDLAKRITAASKSGGPLDIIPSPPPKPVQDSANTPRDASPLVNLQVGDVNVTVKIADEMEKIMAGSVRRMVVSELRAMEARLNRPPVPNAQGSVE